MPPLLLVVLEIQVLKIVHSLEGVAWNSLEEVVIENEDLNIVQTVKLKVQLIQMML